MNKLKIVTIIFLLFLMMIFYSGKQQAISSNFDNADHSLSYSYEEVYKSISINKSSVKSINDRYDNIIFDNEFDDFHPAIAGDKDNRFLSCFEFTSDGVEYYPYFWYSLDIGTTWKESGYFPESVGALFTDIDSNDNGFYGTFGTPPQDYPSQQLLIIAEDLDQITAKIWDWGTYDFIQLYSMCISCYNQEEWDYGGIAGTYDTYVLKGIPFVSYPTSEEGAFLTWLPDNDGYFNCDFVIDEETEMAYGVWDHTIDSHILVLQYDFGIVDDQGHHPFVCSDLINDEDGNVTNPSIEAHNDVIVIVAESNGNIVCFYSNNGLSTVNENIIVYDAKYPEIKTTYDGYIFLCSYLKDGDINSKISWDEGKTWSEECKVENCFVVDEFASYDISRSNYGFFAVWEDNRHLDTDIYFGSFSPDIPPNIEILIQPGFNIGVLAEIYNYGIGDGEEINWSIEIKGGIVPLGRYSSGDIDIIRSDEKEMIRTKTLFGIGNIIISVRAEPSNGDGDSKSIKGFAVGPFVYIK